MEMAYLVMFLTILTKTIVESSILANRHLVILDQKITGIPVSASIQPTSLKCIVTCHSRGIQTVTNYNKVTKQCECFTQPGTVTSAIGWRLSERKMVSRKTKYWWLSLIWFIIKIYLLENQLGLGLLESPIRQEMSSPGPPIYCPITKVKYVI